MSLLRVRSAGIAGVIGSVLFVIGSFIAGSPPASDDPTSKVVAFLADNRDALRWQLVLYALATILLIWFTAGFCALMARGETSPAWAVLPLAGVTLLMAVAIAGGSAMASVLWRGADAVDPKLVQLVWDTNTIAATFVSIAVVVVLVAAGSLIQRTRALPSWLAMSAYVAALLALIALLGILADAGSAFGPGGAFAMVASIVSALWILVTAVLLVRADPAS